MRFTLRFNSRMISSIGVILMIFLASFLSPLQEIFPLTIIILWYILSLLLMFIGLAMDGGGVVRFSRKIKSQLLLWLLLLFVFLFRNSYLKHGDLQYFMIGFSAIFVVLLLSEQKGWTNVAVNSILVTSMIHMIATYVFFFLPSLWKTYSYPIFGDSISGSRGGTTGYTAGLNGHYSTNGTLLAFAALCAIALLLTVQVSKKKKFTVLFIVTVISVLLTQKRAHIIFLAICFVVVYFLYNWRNVSIKTMIKLVAIVLLGALGIEIIIRYVPALSAVFERFTTIGEDTQSLTRLTMWEYAINLFTSHKIFGIGWGEYRYQFVTLNLYEGSANAHNIYLQLLAETGVIGFTIFLLIAIVTLYRSVKMLKRCRESRFSYYERKAIVCSTLFQIFLLLYGFTGNPIYDFCFIYYAISVAICNVVWGELNG